MDRLKNDISYYIEFCASRVPIIMQSQYILTQHIKIKSYTSSYWEWIQIWSTKLETILIYFFVACNFSLMIQVFWGTNLKHNKQKAQILAYAIQYSGKGVKSSERLRLALIPSWFFIFLKMRETWRLKHKIAFTSLMNFETAPALCWFYITERFSAVTLALQLP